MQVTNTSDTLIKHLNSRLCRAVILHFSSEQVNWRNSRTRFCSLLQDRIIIQSASEDAFEDASGTSLQICLKTGSGIWKL